MTHEEQLNKAFEIMEELNYKGSFTIDERTTGNVLVLPETEIDLT